MMKNASGVARSQFVFSSIIASLAPFPGTDEKERVGPPGRKRRRHDEILFSWSVRQIFIVPDSKTVKEVVSAQNSFCNPKN